MDAKITTTSEFRFSPKDIQEIIAGYLKDKHGVTVEPNAIHFNVSDGDPGGYGSWGDPKHVYNSPTPASFNGANVTVKHIG